MARIYEVFRKEVPLRALFETPTLAGLATHLERHDTSLKRSALVPLVRERDHPMSDFPQAGSNTYLFPVSFAQERLWFLDQLEPESAAYKLQTAIHLQGRVIVEALQQSVRELVHRHETLRTTFITIEGRPMQAIAPGLDIPVTVVDLSKLEEDERQAQI